MVSDSVSLWLTIIALGAYHGLNPAMGWPLAVARGMEQGRASAVFATLLPLGGGHFLAMAFVLVPFAWLSWYAQWTQPIRLGAGSVVLLFGLYKLIWPRHPRALVRIPPTQIAWWSFLTATMHGAGLMLLPLMLSLCTTPALVTSAATVPAVPWPEIGHAAVMGFLVRSNLPTALAVASVHTLTMLVAGLAIAWLVYRWLGLRALRSTWFNLDAAWGASLVVAGAAGMWLAVSANASM